MSARAVAHAPAGAEGAAHWRFWGTLILGAMIGVGFLVAQTIVIGVGLHLASGDAGSAEAFAAAARDGFYVSVASLVAGALGCALVVLAIALKRGSSLCEYLSLRAVPLRTLAKWIAVLVPFLVAFDVLSAALGRPMMPEFMRDVWDTADPRWMLWLALVVGAPVFEETFFRGFLLKGFEATFLRPAGAVVVTAALWALIHTQYDAYELTFIFLLGVLFATARLATGSLLVPVALHAITNLAATVETALLR